MYKPVNFRYESASATLVFEHAGLARVINIFAEVKNQGHGRGLMEEIAKYADNHGIELQLIAQQNGDGGLDNDELIDFYKKFDFEEMGRKNGLMHLKRDARDIYISYSAKEN